MFVPGVSGNPGGRPRKNDYLTRLAKEHSLEAIEKLVHWMRQDENPKASVAACSIILDRGYGKPLQQLEVKKEDPFSDLTAEEVNALRDRLNGGGAFTLDQAPRQRIEVPQIGTLQTIQETT